MTVLEKLNRFILLATIVGVCGLLPAGPPAQSNSPATSTTSINRPAAEQGFNPPLHVLIIRHAEKPDDKEDIHLTSRGAARAAALPSLFFIPKAFRTDPAPFPTPDFIFASAQSAHSNRSVETVQPMAKALGGLHIHDKHKDHDFQPVVDHIFADAKHAGKTVLICWHHGKIPDLTRAVLDKAKNGDKATDDLPKHWKDEVFDRVWQITFNNQGEAAFANRPQKLLFEDSAK